MLTDEQIVGYLYNCTTAFVTQTFDVLGIDVHRSELVLSQREVYTLKTDTVNTLIELNFLLVDDDVRDGVSEEVTVKYKLSNKMRAMIDTVAKHKVLRFKNWDNLSFLDLSKTAVIVSHVGKGFVDFEYEGVKYTVRLKTDYRFFEDQYRLRKELKG